MGRDSDARAPNIDQYSNCTSFQQSEQIDSSAQITQPIFVLDKAYMKIYAIFCLCKTTQAAPPPTKISRQFSLGSVMLSYCEADNFYLIYVKT